MLDQLISFLEHAASFMGKDPSNVIAVHSKLGRGTPYTLNPEPGTLHPKP